MSRSHGHTHEYGHGHFHEPAPHAHAPADFGRAFAIGIALNLGFVVVEATYGILSNSMALVADAGHNLSDVLGLVVAWIAATVSKRAPTTRFTYGLGSSSILAALFNALFLLIAVGGIGWEAIRRLANPQPVEGITVMAVAAVGIAINAVTAYLFASGRKSDLNIRGAYLHMVSDAAVSAGVVAAGGAIFLTGWLWLDPVVSLVIVAVIVWGTWSLLADSLAMSLAAVPTSVEPTAVRAFLRARPGVAALHDLHIWPMSTTEIALTAHLVMPDGYPGDRFLTELSQELARRFGIGHATLQIETSTETECTLEPDHVV